MRSVATSWFSALLLGVLATACGGASVQSGGTYRPPALEVDAFLRQYGRERIATFVPPDRSLEALEEARGQARGDERRAVLRDLALAHMWASETPDEREARAHRRDAHRYAQNAAQGRGVSDFLRAEMDFVDVWIAWRTEARTAPRLAERFTTRHTTAGDLLLVAWLVKGEVALGAEQYEDAMTAYRFVLGQIDHPLYAFGLFRTGQCLRALGRQDEARDLFTQARDMGCDRDAAEETLRIAVFAAYESGASAAVGADGVARPTSCAPPAEGEAPAVE